jgi:hypothetical protein
VGTRQWTKPDGTQVTLEAKRGSANVDVGELRAFQNAKAADTSIAAQLAKNPKLIASESYVSQHPELGHFLEQYPNAREDIQRNPGNFLVPVKGSTWNGSAAGRAASAESD